SRTERQSAFSISADTTAVAGPHAKSPGRGGSGNSWARSSPTGPARPMPRAARQRSGPLGERPRSERAVETGLGRAADEDHNLARPAGRRPAWRGYGRAALSAGGARGGE